MNSKLTKKMAVLAIACMSLTMLPAQLFARNAMDVSSVGDRLGGIDRYDTAAKVAQQGWTKSDYAILSAGMDTNLVDALTAAPLAKKIDAPILLTQGDTLNNYAEGQLTRLGVKTVYVTSGNGTIKQNVLNRLTALGIQYEVLGGADRFETSVNIAKKMDKADKIVVATAYTNADALSISAIAAAKGMPILLSPVDALPASVANYLASEKGQITQSYVVGGAGVLSNAVQAALPNASRAWGSDRYATNVEVLRAFDAELKYDEVYVANGTDEHLVDALVVSPLAARTNSPIVLVDKTIPAGTGNYLASKVNHETTGTALGGPTVVTNGVMSQIAGFVAALPTWGVSVTADKASLKADGKDSTIIRFQVKDYKGNNLDTVKGEVEFSTTFGNLGQNHVVLQNGEATVLLTSEYLTTPALAVVTGKVVQSDDQNYVGLSASTTVNMGMDFVPVNKPILSAAESNQADRVTAYFNQSVDVSYFINENGAFNAGINFEVFSQALGKCLPVDVIGVMPVAGDSRALNLILRTPLVDNDNVMVKFTDNTGNGGVASKAPIFTLTDGRPQAMIDSKGGPDMRTVKVYFSEAVDPISARNFNNWTVDGVKLDPAKYTVTVGGFTPNAKGGVDARNVVTIQKKITGEALQDPFWMDAWFTAGTHSVQGSQVGDWAALSDPNNFSATQIIDFTINEDTTVPAATISEQSPEQWLVEFNVPVLQDAAKAAQALKLQVLDSTNHWQDVNAVFTADKNNIDGFKVLVTEIDNNKFLLELTKDWTNYYDSLGQNNKDYYSDKYRVTLADHAFRNPANGRISDAQDLGLEDAVMKSLDVTSPTIVDVTEVTPRYQYTVEMSEPVKLRTAANKPGFNDEGLTQGRMQDNGVPVSMAQFVNGGTTIAATLTMANSGTYDSKIVVRPVQPLGEGTWTLSINAISDDVGNTSATITKDFTVVIPKVFKVDFAFADVDNGLLVEPLDRYDADSQYDYIFVKFTRPIAVTGNAANVLKTSNYTLNGVALPEGTEIFADIQHYDNDDAVVDSMTIRLPQAANSLLKPILGTEFNSPNVLKIAPSVTAVDGQQVTGDLELRLPYNIQNGTSLWYNN